MPKMAFDEHALKVAPGDTLFVYTDGLTDRRNGRGRVLLDRPRRRAARTAPRRRPRHALRSDLRRHADFAATEDFKDDIAFVVTRFQ